MYSPQAQEERGVEDVQLPRAWGVVGILFVLNVLSVVDRNVFAVLIPEIKADLNLSDFEVSTLHGFAFALFYASMGIFVGGLIDRNPRRLILYIGVTVWSLAAALSGLAASFVQMFLARMTIGIGEATVSPGSQSILSDYFPRKRLTSAIAIAVIAGGSLGAGLSFFLGGVLLEYFIKHPLMDLAPWRQVLIVTGAPGVLLAFLVLAFREPARRGAAAGDTPMDIRTFAATVIRERRVVGNLLAAFSMGAIVAVTSQAWGPTFARRVLGASAADVGSVLGLIFAVGGLISIMGTGFLVDTLIGRGIRDAALRVYGASLLVSVPVSVVGYLSENLVLFYVSVALTHFCMAGAFGPAFAAIQMISPARARGRMAALLLLSTTIMAMAVGPMIVGLLTDEVFAAPEKLGWSITTVMVISGVLSLIFLYRAAGEFRARMAG